jgi:LysR family transcriptional regulator, transcriptional activator for dmlA
VNDPNPRDLQVFLTVARVASFAAAADKLGASPAYVSKRIAILEATLGVQLLVRTPRKAILTDHGQLVVSRAQEILATYSALRDDVDVSSVIPAGNLRITASAAMGRTFVAPALAKLSQACPQLEIRLEIVDRSVDLVDENVDLDIRVGGSSGQTEIMHPLVTGRRILCAAPDYLDKFGYPNIPTELRDHACLLIRERNEPYGQWVLDSPSQNAQVQIASALSSNDGEVVRQWALAGRGIMLRSYWDVAEHFALGNLVWIMPDWFQRADVVAVSKLRSKNSARIMLCIQSLRNHFRDPNTGPAVA